MRVADRTAKVVEDLKVGDIWITGRSCGKIVEIEDLDLTRRFWISISDHTDPVRITGSAEICR